MKNYTVSQASNTQVAVTIQTPINTRTAIVNATLEQFKQAQQAYINGEPIHIAFHFLTQIEREFLITGMTAMEFDNFYSQR